MSNQILIIECARENKLPERIRKANVVQRNEDSPEEFSEVVLFDPLKKKTVKDEYDDEEAKRIMLFFLTQRFDTI